jgi:hypothetical protein
MLRTGALVWSQDGDADPPAGYVDFVARHVSRLRREVLQLVADPDRTEQIYPEVLTDVALAWRKLEHARARGHPEAAEQYLTTCLHRRLYRRDDPDDGDDLPELEVRFVVWDAADSGLSHLPPPARENVALRLAGHILPLIDPEPAPLAEAAIAWWHAYEVRRRRHQIAAVVAAVAFLLFPLATVGTFSAGY